MNTAAQGRAERVAELRRLAVQLAEKGLNTKDIAEIVQRKPRAVQLWLAEYRQKGEKALKPRKAPGATPKLTSRQRAGLRRRILKGACSQGFATDLWTAPRIRELVRRLYGVEYHVGYIPDLLRPMGLSRQKPQLVAHERDAAAVEVWRETTWERLKKEPGAGKPR